MAKHHEAVHSSIGSHFSQFSAICHRNLNITFHAGVNYNEALKFKWPNLLRITLLAPMELFSPFQFQSTPSVKYITSSSIKFIH